jgi:uncharacterized protein (TIGR03435 family)
MRQPNMNPWTTIHKAAFLCVLSLLVILTMAMNAQTIVGTWQGTLPAGQDPRIVLKIAHAEDGSLHGVLTFIDRGASGAPILSVTFLPPDLNVTIGDIGYRGKLSTDGKSVDGIWTRDKQSYPLHFFLATADTLWTYSGLPPAVPMSATADPTFEVATIKPSRPDANDWGYSTRTRQFQARDNTVADLIKFAYQVRDRQIDGGPSWMKEMKFDIVAEPDAAGQPSVDQERLMLKKLLADRFGLVAHDTKIVFPVYALTIDKSPPKLTRSDPNASGHGSVYVRDGSGGDTSAQFVYMAMPEFINILMNFIQDRQIVDETGLAGQFDFTLMLPTAVFHSKQGSDDSDKVSAFFHAVQSLGFKLVPKREPLDVIVIDKLEKPSAN